jgi:hypothetical protein
MSAFSTRALSQRPYAALILIVAIACAVAITIAMIAHAGTTSHPLTAAHGPVSGTSVFVRHHPQSNAGYGLNP